MASVAGPQCLAGGSILGSVPARLSTVVAMAPGDVCHGLAQTSGLAVPLLLLARQVGWVAPVRPTLGVWVVAPCCSVALGAYAHAVSMATWRLFSGVHAVWGTRVLLVALLGSPIPSLLIFFLLDAFVCLFLLFFFFLKKRKRGAGRPQAQAWAGGTAGSTPVFLVVVRVAGVFSTVAPQGCGSLLMMYTGAGYGGSGWVSLCAYCPSLPQYIIPHSVVQRTRPHAGLGTHEVGSVRGFSLHLTMPTQGHLNRQACVNRFGPFRTHS